jgi:hypothetical protein
MEQATGPIYAARIGAYSVAPCRHKEPPMPRKSPTIAVNRRALVARIERALAKQDRELHVDRIGNKLRLYLVDTKKQAVVDTDVDLEALAREVGAMKPWERLAE